MVTEALKSTPITNRDASPPTMNDNKVVGGAVREAVGYATTTAGKTTGSTYRLCQIPSNARISRVLVTCAQMSTSTAADFGLYYSTQAGGAVIDADFFSAAKDLSSALKHSDITCDNILSAANQEKALWDAAGLSSDPGGFFDVVATTTATVTTGGAMAVKVTYVGNN